MTVAVAPPPPPALRAEDHPTDTASASSVARKRRREILLHQRAAGGLGSSSTPDASAAAAAPPPQTQTTPLATSVCLTVSPATIEPEAQQQPPQTPQTPLPPVKKRRVTKKDVAASLEAVAPPVASPAIAAAPSAKASTKAAELAAELTALVAAATAAPAPAANPGGRAKKPQMRYDPDVPMSKEATAAWRREQRRKRNRESAAASRQRQRDRISELEGEVVEWQAKFDEAMARLNALEEARGMAPSGEEEVERAVETVAQQVPVQAQRQRQCPVSPHGSPQMSPTSVVPPLDSQARADRASGSSATLMVGAERDAQKQQQQQRTPRRQHLNETISRPA